MTIQYKLKTLGTSNAILIFIHSNHHNNNKTNNENEKGKVDNKNEIKRH